MSYILDETLNLSVICDKCGSNDEKRIKEEKSIEILKILALIIVTRNGRAIWNTGRTDRSTFLCSEPSYTRTHSSLLSVKIETTQRARK